MKTPKASQPRCTGHAQTGVRSVSRLRYGEDRRCRESKDYFPICHGSSHLVLSRMRCRPGREIGDAGVSAAYAGGRGDKHNHEALHRNSPEVLLSVTSVQDTDRDMERLIDRFKPKPLQSAARLTGTLLLRQFMSS
jgi:hypothetical protein